MSRIGKQPITIPEKTSVTKDGITLTVKGPLGELKRAFPGDVSIAVEGSTITLTPKENDPVAKILWGTYASHIKNMIAGVNTAYKKTLIIEGVGYRAELSGKKIVLSLGFSHKIEKVVPEGLTVTIDKGTMTISGIDKEAVGQFAAMIRALKKPEPYKGKGIRYDDEVIRRKQGKKTV